jgi:hypothetical protein
MTKSDRHELLHIHQPHRYGLNDGWKPSRYGRCDIGLDDPLLPAVQALPPVDRLALAALKFPCSTFNGYNTHEYTKFAGGAYLMANDFIGTFSVRARLCTLRPSTSVLWAPHASLRPCAERSLRTPPTPAPRAADACVLSHCACRPWSQT